MKTKILLLFFSAFLCGVVIAADKKNSHRFTDSGVGYVFTKQSFVKGKWLGEVLLDDIVNQGDLLEIANEILEENGRGFEPAFIHFRLADNNFSESLYAVVFSDEGVESEVRMPKISLDQFEEMKKLVSNYEIDGCLVGAWIQDTVISYESSTPAFVYAWLLTEEDGFFYMTALGPDGLLGEKHKVFIKNRVGETVYVREWMDGDEIKHSFYVINNKGWLESFRDDFVYMRGMPIQLDDGLEMQCKD